MALEGQADLYDTPAQQDHTDGTNQGENECGKVVYYSERIAAGCKGSSGKAAGTQYYSGIAGKSKASLFTKRQSIGGFIVLFAVGVVKTCGSFTDVKRPEHALKLFIRFALAKAAVTYGLDLMLAVFKIVQGIISTIITQSGLSGSSGTTLPQEIIDKINNVGFWDSIPLWAVTLLGGLFITVLSFIMILTVYSRMFKLYMYTALAPIPLSSFAGEPTSNVGKNFLRSYAGVCLEGAIIALACIIFSVMAASPPAVDPNVSAVTAV